MSVSFSFALRCASALVIIILYAISVPAQRLVQGSKPRATNVSGFSEAFCSTLSGEFRVCKVKTSDSGDAEYVVESGSSAVNRIPASYWTSVNTTPDGFFAYRGDLDKDGSPEIVLVSQEGVSQGMGVTYADAYIFDGQRPDAEPISFGIQEFGERENFIFDPRSGTTEILISYWAGYDSIEPQRGSGTYLMGKWFRYRNKKLEPALDRPTLARRFLNSFAAERDNGWYENRKPYTWLKDRRTRKFFREPAELGKLIRTERATITNFQPESAAGSGPASLDLTLDSGRALKGKFQAEADPDHPAEFEISGIGLWKQRYLYPLSWSMDFRPATFLDRIEGRRVLLETYRTEHGDEFTKVWLLD